MSKAMEILAAAGIDTRTAEGIERELMEHYRTREEAERKAARIKELEDEGEALRAEVARLSDTTETEELRNRVKEFEEREAARAAKDAEAASRAEFRKAFDAVVGDRRFANRRTEESVFEDAYARHAQNPDEAAEAIVKELTGEDGVFANPQLANMGVPLPKETGREGGDADAKAFVASLFARNKE